MRIVIILLLAFFTNVVHGQTVYSTPTGEKYHLSSCRMVRNVSTALRLPEAIKKGLLPCKICKPPVAGSVTQGTQKVLGESGKGTVRCKGYTKKGTRCKHMTAIANGYCFQHNPD